MGKYDIERAPASASGSPSKGCPCSTAVGALSILLAITVAVGVGLVVHFAEKANDAGTVCDSGLSLNDTVGKCLALASEYNKDICGACDAASTPASPVPTLTTTPTTAAPPRYPIRLPTSLLPVTYRLVLKPDFYSNNATDFNFHGSVSIFVTCLEDTDEVILHLKGLQLQENSLLVTEENGVENLFDSYELYDPSELIIIRTKAELLKGRNYTIEFTEFWAPISNNFLGFYLGQYQQDGETTYHVATQMEPTFARTAFPCFDEPGMKATFDITLVRKGHVTAISNMPIVYSEQDDDGWVHDRFQLTPVMPTYLLAFIVGDFTNTTASYKDKFPISVWSREEVQEDRRYALEIAPTLQEYFENLFGIEYVLPKIDMIGMQSFIFGAMENWGAYTFREQYLLYKEGTTLTEKFHVISKVAHEISHHWVGNLVSPAWWDDLWLNEAFATYMEHVGVNVISPEWKSFDILVKYVFQYALPFDEKVSSHPIYVEGLEKTDDIFAVFDDIVYLKGGHMVRMVEQLIGEEVFSRGLNRYITKYMYGNTRHQDLWEAMQAEVDLANSNVPDIHSMMDTWIFQMGFPTVYVNFTEDGTLLLSQNRYLKDQTAPDPGIYTSEYGYKWDIPFTFTSSSEKNFDLPSEIILMNHTENLVHVTGGRIPSPTGDNWVIGNLQALAFLQVNYDQRNWDAIIKQLKTDHTVIHPINRIQLIHDAWNLAKSRDLNLDTALRCAEYIRNEREYGPWSLLTSEWDYVSRMLRGNQLLGSFRRFVKETISPAYAEFSAMPSSSLGYSDILIKATVLDQACRYGVEDCIEYTSTVFSAWMANPQNKPLELSTDLADAILCSAVRNGEAAEFEFMLEVYVNSSLQAEKIRALRSMACTQHLWLVDRYTSQCLDGGKIAQSDIAMAVISMAINGNQPAFLWDWFRNNYDALQNRLASYYIGLIVDYIAQNFNSEIRQRELQQFAAEKKLAEHSSVMNGLATVGANVQWMKDSVPILRDWLASNGH